MRQLLTHSETATWFSTAIGDPAEAAPFMRQLRHLESMGLIKPCAEPRDRRGTSQFTRNEGLLARLLIAATDYGMTRSDLEWLAVVISKGRRLAGPLSDGIATINLAQNVDRIARGEQWLIEMVSGRSASPDDRKVSALWVRREADGKINRFGNLNPDPFAADTIMGNGRPVEFVGYLNASRLLAPLVGAEA